MGSRFTPVDWEAEFRDFMAQVQPLAPGLRPALEHVVPSRSGGLRYRPCAVELYDGTDLDCVYVVEARAYYSLWGVAPWKDPGKQHVPVERIRHLRSSPARLDPALATRLYSAGENGMGYHVFELILGDGSALSCISGNALDFIDLPAGVEPGDIVDVRPGKGAGRERPDCSSRSFAWSVYLDDSSRPGDPLY